MGTQHTPEPEAPAEPFKAASERPPEYILIPGTVTMVTNTGGPPGDPQSDCLTSQLFFTQRLSVFSYNDHVLALSEER